MRESDTYLAILDEGAEIGAAREARKVILFLGEDRFGQPGEDIKKALEGIADLECLERLIRSVHRVSGWQELLQQP